MENFLILCGLGFFFFGSFTVSMILAALLRMEKHLKTISEDLKILSLLKK